MWSVYLTLTTRNTQKRMAVVRFCVILFFMALNLSGMIECKKIKKFLVQVEEQESTEKRIYTKMTTQDPEDEYADYLRPLWDTGLNVYYDQPNLENW